MSVKEKYDGMITNIEHRVREPYSMVARDIADAEAVACGMKYTDLSTVFSYLTGMTLVSYVKERKLMYAYEKLIAQEDPDMQEIIDISGYDNQASFCKKFKERFAITPQDANREKDPSLLESPKKWDLISADKRENIPVISESKEKTKFGVSQEQMKKISECYNLEALYEFRDYQSEMAFRLSEMHPDVKLRDIFEYVDDYSNQYYWEDQKDFCRRILADKKTIYIYTKFRLSVSESIELCGEFSRSGFNILDMDRELIKKYLEVSVSSCTVKEFVELYKQFKEYGFDDINMFIIDIRNGLSPEEIIDIEDLI